MKYKSKLVISLLGASLLISTISYAQKYSQEQIDAYEWAFDNGITTQSSIDKAKLDSEVTRQALAKMIITYKENILGEKDLSSNCRFTDESQFSSNLLSFAKKACAAGIMGENGKAFKPTGIITRAQFGTILSRLLYGNSYNVKGSNYYSEHLKALKRNGIVSNINNPNKIVEKRGNIMIMLMRSVVIVSAMKDMEQQFNQAIEEMNKEIESKHQNQKSGLYNFYGHFSINGQESFNFYSIDNPNDGVITISTDKYPKLKVFSEIYKYSDCVYYYFDLDNGEVKDRRLVDRKTNEKLGKMSAEQLDKKFDIIKYATQIDLGEQGGEEIKLSSLNEKIAYKYSINPIYEGNDTKITTMVSGRETVTYEKQMNYYKPSFINDLGKYVVVYSKDDTSLPFGLNINSKVLFSGESFGGFGIGGGEDELSEYFLYKILSKDDVLVELGDKVSYLSKLKFDGDSKSSDIDDYIYNDTKDIKRIIFIDEFFGEEKVEDTVELKSGEIYKVPSFVDYIRIDKK